MKKRTRGGGVKFLIISLGLLAVIAGLDIYVGSRQDAIIQEKEARIQRLEKQAFYLISAEIRDVRESADIHVSQNYIVTLRIDSVADEPVYVSHPHVKAFVQTGEISMTEVAVNDDPLQAKEQVYKIEDRPLRISKILTIDRKLPYNQHLLRKYMHVKFFISIYVLPESGFKEGEVVERRAATFVYIKPYYLSDQEILAVHDFDDDKVPTYIPITAFRKWND